MGKQKKYLLSRRKFLQQCAAITLGSSTLAATMARLQLANAATDPSSDYKALVCIFLFGGNDSYNMVVPTSTSAYATYANVRQNLAIPQSNLLSITPAIQSGIEYGFHPSMNGIRDLFQNENLAILANAGTLVEPITKSGYLDKTQITPPQLFSHNDQQTFVQALNQSTATSGWAGRIAEIMSGLNINNELSMNISLSGSNIWQTGNGVIPYAINGTGIESLNQFNKKATDNIEISRTQIYQTLLQSANSHVFAKEYATVQQRAWILADNISETLAAQTPLSTNFPSGSKLATDLKMVANLISARDALQTKRQIFFIGMGDFDTHGDQENRQPALFSELSAGLTAFNAAMSELNMSDKVTAFTATDFGRTLTSNGDGTDHAWGGHQLIMGGAVQGRNIYGTMPSLALNSDDDIGEGRIIPSTSIDQYGATLARWFGVPSDSINTIFPNLNHFNTTNLGFMKV